MAASGVMSGATSSPTSGAQPLWFGPPDRPLFGMLHPPRSRARRCGVVVCTSLGTDFTRASCTLRHLAEHLACAGFPTLRYDLRGTGDSAGDEHDPDLVRAWLADLGLAQAELRARGAAEIAVVGLRLGATLAMTAAAELGGVESLVLWSPCLTGPDYVTEVVKLHRLYERLEPDMKGPKRPGGQEALGMFLPDTLITALQPIDVLAIDKRPARRALVVDAGNFSGKDKLLAHLSALGATPDYQLHRGQKFLVTVSHRSVVPHEVLTSITEWLSAQHPEPGAFGDTNARGEAALSDGVVERAVWFGTANPLFGILSIPPAAARRPGRPAIVITNAGAVNRTGPHRASVCMARRWAALGFHVLRVDLSGIGDSPVVAGAAENLCYPRDGMADVTAGMDYLRDELAADRFVIVGLCSGGDYAFQIGLADPRVASAVILNPRTFCVLDLQAVESQSGEPPATTVGSVPASLRRMVESGVDTLVVVSERDPGVLYVDSHFPAEMTALRELPGFTRVDLAGADHTFTPAWAQARVSDVVTEHLLAKFH